MKFRYSFFRDDFFLSVSKHEGIALQAFPLGWQFTGCHKFCFGKQRGFLEFYGFVFDSDEIGVIERPCGHYVYQLISCRRLFKFSIVATKSPGGADIMISEQNREIQESVEDRNARLSVSNNIDFSISKII